MFAFHQAMDKLEKKMQDTVPYLDTITVARHKTRGT